MAFLRFRRNSSNNEVFSKVSDLESLVSDLGGKIESMQDNVMARLREFSGEIEFLRDRVSELASRLERSSVLKDIGRDPEIRGLVYKIRRYREILEDKALVDRDVRARLYSELESMEKQLKQRILVKIAEVIMEKLLQG